MFSLEIYELTVGSNAVSTKSKGAGHKKMHDKYIKGTHMENKKQKKKNITFPNTYKMHDRDLVIISFC